MPVEFYPPALKSIANPESSIAKQRLKNRDGELSCQNCPLHEEGLILELVIKAQNHDDSHNMNITESCCTSVRTKS